MYSQPQPLILAGLGVLNNAGTWMYPSASRTRIVAENAPLAPDGNFVVTQFADGYFSLPFSLI